MARRILCITVVVIVFVLVCTKSVAQAPAQPRSETVRIQVAPGMTIAQLESKGDELRRQKAYAESLVYYREALKKNANNPILWNKAGMAELQLGRLSQAQKDFERAIKRDRDYAEAYNNLGVIAYMRKSYKKAIQHYQKALTLREESASFHSNLGATYFARNQMEQAVAEYSRAMELDPEILIRSSAGGVAAQIASPEARAQYWYLLAKMYAKRGDCERCVHCLRKAQEEGYPRLQDVKKDPEFATVREDPRIAELVAGKAQR
ncbi:MAG TPA: tetratricopeptide repeat protein [Terriglobales bacterium]|jgi:tetratricopeptide (TPR) repeat protein|nr:tetratricopeptide repeat protein [Terriglobales bacterium]